MTRINHGLLKLSQLFQGGVVLQAVRKEARPAIPNGVAVQAAAG